MIELALRVIFSLAVVVGLLLLVARFAGRRFQGKAGSGIQVLQRQQLSRGSSVALVDVAGRVLVLGMTEHQVSLLTELDPLELKGLEPAPPAETTPPVSTGSTSGPGSANGGRHTATPTTGALAGSVLSTQTWRAAFQAVTSRSA